MRIGITGGTGFIGRRLARSLLESGHHVWVLTRRVPVGAAALNGVEYCTGDLREAGMLPAPGQTEIVYHLAADLNYFGRRRALHRTNVLGTLHAMQWAHALGARSFVNVSSTEAVGPQLRGEAPVGAGGPCRPVSSYGRSKRDAERVVRQTSDRLNLPAVTLRLGCIYGAGSRAFVPAVLAGMRTGFVQRWIGEIAAHTLPLVHAADAVEALLRAPFLAGIDRPVTAAPERSVSMAELVAGVAERAGMAIVRPGPSAPGRLRLTARTCIHRIRGKADLLSFLTAGGAKRVHRSYLPDDLLLRAGVRMRVGLVQGIRETLDRLAEGEPAGA